MKYISHLFLSFLLLFICQGESGGSNSLPFISKSGVANTITYIHPPVTIIRTCVVSYELHTVKYTYNPSEPFTLPAVGGAINKPHYSAFITVFSESRGQISKGWFGQVVPDGGCIEDVPENMVELAYQKEREELEGLIKDKRSKTNEWRIEGVTITKASAGQKIEPGVYTVINYSVSITTNIIVLTNYNFKITTNVLSFTNNVNSIATNTINK